MKYNPKKILSILCLTLSYSFFAQVKVGDNATTLDNSAVFEVESTNKGILIPRIALTSTQLAAPVAQPSVSLLVYNTASVNDVTPGFYFWNGTVWSPIVNSVSSNDTSWTKIGNSGTNSNLNFIGTTDNQDLVLKSNNTERVRIDADASVAIYPSASNTGSVLQVLGSGLYPSSIAFSEIGVNKSFFPQIDKRNIFGTNSTFNFNTAYYDPNAAGEIGWLYINGAENDNGTYRMNQVIGDPYARIHKIQFNAHTGGSGAYTGFSFRETNEGSTKDIFEIQKTNFLNILRINNQGNMLLGGTTTVNASSQVTSKLDIVSPTGYNQLRLRTSYTPTSSTDSNGNIGDTAWDDNFFYIKTTQGWKRTNLSSF